MVNNHIHMGTIVIVSFIALSALLMGATQGSTVYNVGDNLGWRFPPNASYYSEWASSKTFSVGDKLIFNWTGTHTVGDVSKADYDSCNTKASAFGSNSVNVTVFQINILHSGPRYFMCTVGNHCLRGMKFSINVESGDGNAAAPAAPPPASSAPTTFSFGLVLSAVLSTTFAYLFTCV